MMLSPPDLTRAAARLQLFSKLTMQCLHTKAYELLIATAHCRNDRTACLLSAMAACNDPCIFRMFHNLQMYKTVTAPEKDAEGNRIPISRSLSRRMRAGERPSMIGDEQDPALVRSSIYVLGPMLPLLASSQIQAEVLHAHGPWRKSLLSNAESIHGTLKAYKACMIPVQQMHCCNQFAIVSTGGYRRRANCTVATGSGAVAASVAAAQHWERWHTRTGRPR